MTGERERGSWPLWKRLWLLVTVIWVVVALLNVATILAFGDAAQRSSVLWPLAAAVLVPTALYAIAWAWARWLK